MNTLTKCNYIGESISSVRKLVLQNIADVNIYLYAVFVFTFELVYV